MAASMVSIRPSRSMPRSRQICSICSKSFMTYPPFSESSSHWAPYPQLGFVGFGEWLRKIIYGSGAFHDIEVRCARDPVFAFNFCAGFIAAHQRAFEHDLSIRCLFLLYDAHVFDE